MQSQSYSPLKILGRLLLICACLLPLQGNAADEAALDFPNQPIRIIVYTSPGGLIDFTARRFAEVARKHAPDQPFVVINRPGGGGIVAFEEVLQMPANGYTLMAVTRSNISKLVATGRSGLIDAFDWHAYIMDNPHVLITHTQGGLQDWDDLLSNAREQDGRQLWLGADIGGVKHVSGIKMARAADIDMRWIPYSSGGQAIAALMGNLGGVYLGNPNDAMRSDDLRVAVVAARERMADFPDKPTFTELGIDGLEDELIWRGFALRKGVPEPIKEWYSELIQAVVNDPDWIDGWAGEGVNLTYRGPEEFSRIVDRDRDEFAFYLRDVGLVYDVPESRSRLRLISETPGRYFFSGFMLTLNIVLAVMLFHSGLRPRAGEIVLLLVLTSLSVLFYLLTVNMPPPSPIDRIGAQGVPRLWIILMIPLAITKVYLLANHPLKGDPKNSPRFLIGFISLLLGYALLIPWIGYHLLTLIYLPAILWMLGYRRPLRIGIITVAWLLFSWLVFQRLLYVDLPGGLVLSALPGGLSHV